MGTPFLNYLLVVLGWGHTYQSARICKPSGLAQTFSVLTRTSGVPESRGNVFGHEGMAWSSQLLIQLLPMPAFMCCRDVDIWDAGCTHASLHQDLKRYSIPQKLAGKMPAKAGDVGTAAMQILLSSNVWGYQGYDQLVRFQSLLGVKRKSIHAFNFNNSFQSVTFSGYWETNWFFTQFIINLKGSYAMIWEISGSL